MRIRCKPYTLHTFELISASKLFQMYGHVDVRLYSAIYRIKINCNNHKQKESRLRNLVLRN